MEYSKASRLRKQSLLSLIGEKKFEEHKGLGASIGGAISDKFKAKLTGLQASLDPLNLVRKLTGKGAFGDIATTAAGRLFGRSDKSIAYFGGFRRKPRNKNPNFTTIGNGPVRPLRVDDSIANILGKMYNFMRRTSEKQIEEDEIAKAFRQEKLDNDDRRHKELIKAITGSKKTKTAEPVKETGGGFLDTLMGIINSLLDNPLIKLLMDGVKNGLLSIFNGLMSAGKWLFTLLSSPAGLITALDRKSTRLNSSH